MDMHEKLAIMDMVILATLAVTVSLTDLALLNHSPVSGHLIVISLLQPLYTCWFLVDDVVQNFKFRS